MVAQTINHMKYTSVLKTISLATLAIGIATPAFASDCHVREGDTIWRIAKRYHIDFHHLKDLNDGIFRDLDLIHPKDKVDLPDGQHGQSTSENSEGDNIKDGSEEMSKDTSEQALAVLRLVNQEREKNGLKALVLSHTLNGIANEKAFDMKEKKYFSHDSPTYGSPFEMLQRFGVKYSHAGENIAKGQASAEQVMDDWMHSSGHRANILNPNYTELGVGYAEEGRIWVQLFIKP